MFLLRKDSSSPQAQTAAPVVARKHKAGRGRRFTFHGAFGTKAKAAAKERSEGKGAFIRRVTIRGRRRYVVMKKK